MGTERRYVDTRPEGGASRIPFSLLYATLGETGGAGGQTAASGQERCDFKSGGSRTMCSA